MPHGARRVCNLSSGLFRVPSNQEMDLSSRQRVTLCSSNTSITQTGTW